MFLPVLMAWRLLGVRMTRTKVDLDEEDRVLLDSLCHALRSSNRSEAARFLIKKCAQHLIDWVNSDLQTLPEKKQEIESPSVSTSIGNLETIIDF